MCGITGILDYKSQPERKTINSLLNPIHHRGPDATGVYLNTNIAMGMKRLSIIDLKNGNQPIFNEDKSLAIVFNGEIYNYLELKSDLIKKGHKFKNTSDTEVIVHLYEEYGYNSPKFLNGMFAYSIWDIKKQELFIVRDHAGIKPLFYYFENNIFLYGSELKSILTHPRYSRKINKKALNYYFYFGYIPTAISIYDGINKLKPGHFLIISKKGIKEGTYLPFEDTSENKQLSLDELIADSVKKQSVADVPVGVFLSGGLDSSLITHYLRQVKKNKLYTFSIAFSDKSFDESDYALEVAKLYKTTHLQESFSSQDIIHLMPKISGLLDEPLADPSLFPTFKVSKLARSKVKVVLSGDGGDELFGGYPTYQGYMMAKYFYKLSPNIINMMKKVLNIFPSRLDNYPKTEVLKTFFAGIDMNSLSQHQKWMSLDPYNQVGQNIISKNDIINIDNKILDLDDVKSLQYLDFLTYLRDDLLVKVDRASMFNSLEVRVPFLDPRIINYAFNYTHNHLNLRQTKILLRNLAKDHFSENIVKRKKKGFGIPIGKWLTDELKDFGFAYLSNKKLEQFVSRKKIAVLWSDHQSKKRNNARLLWMLIMLSNWLNDWN